MKKILIPIIIVLVCLAGGGYAVWHSLESSVFAADEFADNITINGVDCSNLTKKQAEKKLVKEWNSKKFHFEENGTEIGSIDDLNFTYDLQPELDKVMREHPFASAFNHFFSADFDVSMKMPVKKVSKSFAKDLKKADYLQEDKIRETKNAFVDISSGDFKIIPEVQGNNVDYDVLTEAITDLVAAGTFTMDYKASDFYEQPKITADSEEIKDQQALYKEYLSSKVTYVLGEEEVKIPAETLQKIYDFESMADILKAEKKAKKEDGQNSKDKSDKDSDERSEDQDEKSDKDSKGIVDKDQDTSDEDKDDKDDADAAGSNSSESNDTQDADKSVKTSAKDSEKASQSDDKGADLPINEEEVAKFVQEFAKKYNTFGKTREFTSLSGKKIKVSGGDYGFAVSQEKETKQLVKDLKSGKEVKREPVWAMTGFVDYNQADDVGDTYVDISLADQHLWYFKDGKKIVDCPVVTGNRYQHDTPTGTFGLSYKQRGATLRGDNGDGSRYESPVSYWMPFYGNYGMHDAPWRSSFGGKIYQGGGSHGCVNMPIPAAKKLFENLAEKNVPVIVHW